jgi:hypothetical protein
MIFDSAGLTKGGTRVPAPDRRLAHMRVRIAPSLIHFLKFILEGYDGLAVLSTVDQKTGLVEIKYPRELRADLDGLLESMAEGLELVRQLQPGADGLVELDGAKGERKRQ